MTRSRRALLLVAGVLAGLAWGAVHVAAIGREAVNWDEFATFSRAAALLRTGQLQGGGRPGLAEVVLAPFVRGCSDGLAAVKAARWLWSLFTFAAGAALFAILRSLRPAHSSRAAGALVGVGLWALVPAVMRWSVQVRTDQGALAFGLAGGLALLLSRERRGLALLGGGALGVGFLFTQKLVYVALLIGIVVVADTMGREDADPREEARPLLLRFLLAAGGGAAAIGFYRWGLSNWVRLPPGELLPLSGGLRVFEHYRSVFGFVVYRAMVPTLAAHLVLGVLLAARTLLDAVRGRWHRSVMLAWVLLLAGVAVGAFHAGAFPYFWMTLGLFPAAAFAVCWGELVEVVPAGIRPAAVAGILALLVIPAVSFARSILRDSQRPQREAFQFIGRNFAPQAPGYQIEGALFCRPDPDPFPVLFREHLDRYFRGPEAARYIGPFLDRFRSRQVRFFVYSHMTPLFPPEIRRFWGEHYIAYRGAVWVPGRAIGPLERGPVAFEVLVPGEYRWLAGPGSVAAITIDGRNVDGGDRIALAAGAHAIDLHDGGREGILALALADSPAPVAGPFYSGAQIREITGGRFF